MRRIAARAVNLGEGDEGKWLPVREVPGRVPRTQPGGKRGALIAVPSNRTDDGNLTTVGPEIRPFTAPGAGARSEIRRLSELNHIKHG
jgi:hypothetical protein